MPRVQFQRLSEAERREALQAASLRCGRRTQLLENDIRVATTLSVLFGAPFGHHLVFKGGTSLSKVWRAIRRFSEDIDITYDVRDFVPDLVAVGNEEKLPHTRSQEKRWTRAIERHLPLNKALSATNDLSEALADPPRLRQGQLELHFCRSKTS